MQVLFNFLTFVLFMIFAIALLSATLILVIGSSIYQCLTGLIYAQKSRRNG